jgi:DUF1009 family protein
MDRFGLIAGNGKFPFLVLEAARSQGIEMVVVAIREEACPEIESQAKISHWVGLGQLGRLIKIFKAEGVRQAIMAGQVKHRQIFSSIVPDLRLLKVLTSLKAKNTDSLIGAIAGVLEEEGITLVDSTIFLKPLIPDPGILTARDPDESESRDIHYGRKIAREIARLDLGQTLVEGTDAVIRRAALLTGNKRTTVIKVSKPSQDMRFDVPVIGLGTLELMAEVNASALAIDAHKTLLIDREKLISYANQHRISISAHNPHE